MGLRRIRFVILIIVSFIVISALKVSAVEVSRGIGEENEKQIIEYQADLFNWEEIEELQKRLGEMPDSKASFNLKEEVLRVVKGEKQFSIQDIVSQIGKLLFSEMDTYIKSGVRLILIVLLCSMLQSLSASFQSKDTNKVAFFVCYMIIAYSVIQSIMALTSIARETIDKMSDVMYVCIPTLLAFMSSSGYISSSAALAPVVIASLNMVTYVIKTLVLPCIASVITLEIIGTISDDFKIDKLVELFYKGIKWVLRGMFLISVTVMGFYKATLPYVDMTVKKSALKISSAFIPVVGDAVGGAVDFIINCSMLMKNAFSVGVIIWLILIMSIPLINMLAFVIVYHVAGAAIEPLGEKKMAHIAVRIAKGGEFIMSCVGIVVLLCISVLIICMSVGSHMI